MLKWLKFRIKILLGNEKINFKFSNKQNVYIFLAADYENLGDVAITYAQTEYLKSIYKNANIIEVPLGRTLDYIKNIKRNIKKEDVITIIGGGNMGNIYEYYEELRRIVINTFKNNFIISFPQTIDFSNEKNGKKSLAKTIKTVNKHKHIVMLAREKKTYEKMSQYFKCEVKLIPDIVFYLKNRIQIEQGNRTKIGICFRKDKEESHKLKNIKKILIGYLKDKEYTEFSTYLENKEFVYEDRYEQFKNLLKRISEFKFIVTDRLHAMIFAYLVNTPCYFLDNSNKKISNTYHTWLEKCENIFEIDEKNYTEMIKKITNEKVYNYEMDSKLESEFNRLKAELVSGNFIERKELKNKGEIK